MARPASIPACGPRGACSRAGSSCVGADVTSASIVIHVHQEPEAFRATLAAVRAHTPRRHDLVIVADGADAAIDRELNRVPDARIVRHGAPRGAAACLNLGFIDTAAEVVALLESGSVPAPGWLDLLLAPFEHDATCGITGPSTNLSWNEQAAFAGCGGTAAEVAATADQARARYGTFARTL